MTRCGTIQRQRVLAGKLTARRQDCGALAGKSTLNRLDARIDRAQRELMAPLSASERRELIRLLERLISNPPVG